MRQLNVNVAFVLDVFMQMYVLVPFGFNIQIELTLVATCCNPGGMWSYKKVHLMACVQHATGIDPVTELFSDERLAKVL